VRRPRLSNPKQKLSIRAQLVEDSIATDLFHAFEGVTKLFVDLVELRLADVQQLLTAFLFPDVNPVGYEGQ
jgi:hypothetical protein